MPRTNYRINTTEKRTSDLEDPIKVFFQEHTAKSQREKEIMRKKNTDFPKEKNMFNRNLRHYR